LLAKGIIAGLGSNNADIAVCVPYVYLPCVSELVKDTPLALGSQMSQISHQALIPGKFQHPC